jgi:hypothetical protein
MPLIRNEKGGLEYQPPTDKHMTKKEIKRKSMELAKETSGEVAIPKEVNLGQLSNSDSVFSDKKETKIIAKNLRR